MLSVNQVLQEGRYRIVGQTGQEGTGLTYQAFDNVLNTNVTIKETVFDTSNQPLVSKQLEGLVSIKHESFLKVHTYFSEVNRQYLVTESVEGENLKILLDKKKRPFLLFDVLSWTEQLLDALTYLHSQTPPVIHDNVRPSSLFLIKNNKIKLLSSTVNLSKNESQKTSVDDSSLAFSSLESFWNTLDPPAQKVIVNSYDERSAEILESPIDQRSDLYALGATIYYLVTGVVPVNALERSIDIMEGKDDPLTNPSKINPQIPRNFSHFLLKSLELKRENRFDSAAAMRTALQPMLELMKKVERETQKALEDPKVREAALREVELAREALRKQKEETQPPASQIQQILPESPKPVEAVPPIPVPEPVFEPVPVVEPEAVKQELRTEKKEESIPSVPVEPQRVEPQKVETPKVAPPPVQPPRFETKVDSNTVENSVLVAPAPVEPVSNLNDSFETMIDDEPELFASAQAKSGKSWLIPVICVVVALLVGGFFGFQYLNSKNQAETNQAGANQPEVKQNQVTNSEETRTETPAPVNSETPASVNTQTTPSTTEPAPTAETQKEEPAPAGTIDKNKKVTVPTPVPVDKKPTPAAKTTPTPKKLTVDDIIN